MSRPDNANIARHLALMAGARPDAAAIKVPRGRTPSGDIDYLALSFAELDAEAAAWGARLARGGVARGDRTLLMVRPGLPLVALAFALFRIGAVPVVIDPGMGLGNLLRCVAQARPRALVGIGAAQWIGRVFRRSFRSVSARVRVSGSLTARCARAPGAPAGAAGGAEAAAGDLAAILFTSGSTGAPKGVCYEHGMFEAQVRMIREAYSIEPGEVDLTLLPIFALFSPALGMTSIIPEMDPRRPAAADPARIVRAIRQENVTNAFGSPTLWRMIADHCLARGTALPSLRRVLCAGAPVPDALWDSAAALLPNGRLHSPYGATEALPISTIDAAERIRLRGRNREILAAAPVGPPLPGIRVKIIAIDDAPIPSLAGVRELPPGQVGEIIVSGPVVTRQYDNLPEATALAKIPDGQGFWHRMGDCGLIDDDGCLWFFGRKAERVETADGPLFTEPCERVFLRHPGVRRCALVGLGGRGRQVPALVVEGVPEGAVKREVLVAELRGLAVADPRTQAIDLFFFHPKFPVDVRHNAKIHRLALARWAEKARGFRGQARERNRNRKVPAAR